jgi:hypothetical protein
VTSTREGSDMTEGSPALYWLKMTTPT